MKNIANEWTCVQTMYSLFRILECHHGHAPYVDVQALPGTRTLRAVTNTSSVCNAYRHIYWASVAR